MTDETAKKIIESMIDLGPEGHEILIEAMTAAWKTSTEKLLDESVVPGDGDVEAVVTDMLQVSMAMDVASSLSGAFVALSKYNLAQKVLEELASQDDCGHSECEMLRKARANPGNN